ncbi:hypothetical protein G4V03_20575 [Escherichia coli]|nr:hypothetical protein [Escherichia coli]
MNIDKNEQEIIKNAINKCFVSMSKNCLELRPRERFYGILSSKNCLLMILIILTILGYTVYRTSTLSDDELPPLIMIVIITSCSLILIVEYAFISRITTLSNIVINRKTRMYYAYYNNKKYINDIDDVIISGGAKTMISLHHRDKNGVMLTKNIEIDDEYNIKIITDYIKQFIRDGQSTLPIPTKLDWIDLGSANISLSPCKALRHYAPWPFCATIVDPTEKAIKIYLWPLYTFIMFPINIFFALIWYPFTKIFNIKPHPVPEEAYEGDDSIRVTPEMAAKGIRP